jgi:predicted PurR-regulated permease PerM
MEQRPLGNKILNFLENSGNSQITASFVKNFFSSGFGIVNDLYIIVLLAAFFIASPSIYRNGLIKLLPPSAKDMGGEILVNLNKDFKKWLQGQIFGFFFIATLTALGLWIIGLPLILTLALIAGLSNFIPKLRLVAAIPAILLGLTLGTSVAVFVACLYVLIQIIQSAVTQPLIQKRMLSIPPALIIFGQVVMGLMAGFWGVLLATPVVVIIMILVNKLYIERQASQIK